MQGPGLQDHLLQLEGGVAVQAALLQTHGHTGSSLPSEFPEPRVGAVSRQAMVLWYSRWGQSPAPGASGRHRPRARQRDMLMSGCQPGRRSGARGSPSAAAGQQHCCEQGEMEPRAPALQTHRGPSSAAPLLLGATRAILHRGAAHNAAAQRGSSSRCGAGLPAGRKAPSAPPGARRAAPALPAAASRGRCEPALRRAADRQQRPLSLAPLGTGCTFLTARPSVTFQSFQANDS